MVRHSLVVFVLALLAQSGRGAGPQDVSATVRQDLAGADRGRRVAAFMRYAASTDATLSQAAIQTAMASDDWLLQSAAVREVIARAGGLNIELSTSPDYPRADRTFLSAASTLQLGIVGLHRPKMTFSASFFSSTGGRGSAVQGSNASGQLIGTVLTLGFLSGPQGACSMQIVLSEPWIMSGLLHCTAQGSYLARVDLRKEFDSRHTVRDEPGTYLTPEEFRALGDRQEQQESQAISERLRRAVEEQIAKAGGYFPPGMQPPVPSTPAASPKPAPADERAAIERDARVVNELFGLLRRPAAAEVLGALEALIQANSPIANDIALEAGLSSTHAAARALTFRMILNRTKALLLVPETAPSPPPGGVPSKGAAFGVVYSGIPIGAVIGHNMGIDAHMPGRRMTGLLTQFVTDGILLAPNYTIEGDTLRIELDDLGRIIGTFRATRMNSAPGMRATYVTDETKWMVPALVR